MQVSVSVLLGYMTFAAFPDGPALEHDLGWLLRILAGVIGGLGSYFALFYRPPQSTKEGATRAALGAFTVFCTVGKAIEWLNWKPSIDNTLFLAWLIGLFSFVAVRVIYDAVEKWLPGAVQSKLGGMISPKPDESKTEGK